MRRRKRIFGFAYLNSINRLVPVIKNKQGEIVAYQIYNEKIGKHQLIKI
jgi:hypothetical protein